MMRAGGGREAEQPATSRGPRPLSDVRVLDLTRLVPGGFCTLLLADLGADVIKVEDTGSGDYLRWAPPYYGSDEHNALGTRSALYLALNRNKRSVRIDLKQERGRQALLKLAESADVLVESFRPGVLEKLGVGYEVLRQANPALVYCPITGYGQDGPNRDRAGHDMNYLGLNAVLGLTGEIEGAPIQASVQIADLGGGGLMAAVGILTALHEARRSGEGQMVDVSMTDGSLAWLAMEASRYFASGEVPRRGELMLSGGLICYRPYEAKDGWVSCGALEPKFWQAFCRGVGREDLVPKQLERPGSDAHTEVAEIFRGRTREEWRAFNDEHDAMIEPILELGEALESELVREREMTISHEQPGFGEVRQLGFPIKLSRTPAGVERPAPALGEHTRDLLAEAGYSEDELEELEESGAAKGPETDARARDSATRDTKQEHFLA
jgi:alpha-methylacyl-CoA racemase